MILEQIKNWKGAVEINGALYSSVEEALKIDFKTFSDDICIILHTETENATQRAPEQSDSVLTDDKTYRITVKQYMTRPASPQFDFMAKWNNNNPMPLRVMSGKIVKETKGMVYMKLNGYTDGKPVQFCMKCCRPITNKVSQFFGMGPECGGHNYINPFSTQEELDAAVKHYNVSYLQKITWEGWIIKSAITEKEEM